MFFRWLHTRGDSVLHIVNRFPPLAASNQGKEPVVCHSPMTGSQQKPRCYLGTNAKVVTGLTVLVCRVIPEHNVTFDLCTVYCHRTVTAEHEVNTVANGRSP